jgi:hypothetical protein
VNEKIAQALAEDVKRRSSNGGTFKFHDDFSVYTVSASVERTLNKSFRDSAGQELRVSGGAAGASCGCCNGSGRV